MSDDPDFLFALKLQQQLDGDISNSEPSSAPTKMTQSSGEDDADFQLALKLQAEMNAADADVSGDESVGNEGVSIFALDMSKTGNNNNKKHSNRKPPPRVSGSKELMKAPSPPRAAHDNYLDQTQNLVHPEWELVDPTPDIFAMFVRFDQKFFQRRLGAVVVEWSKRMYSCAGICYQRGNRFVKEVIIRLSEPLLKLRPRKDLVETLLHEMIHAYCFVLNIREGNGGHGPNFKRIMGIINKVAGTNITVYHTFHDEVDAYKTHIWRCNGICQYHNPFQGWVKRTSNRAPGPSDQWWAKHQRECGGTFEKRSEPAKSAAKKPSKPTSKYTTRMKNETTTGDDIRKYFGKSRTSVNLLPQVQPALGLPGAFPPTSYPGVSSKPFDVMQTSASKKRRGNIVGFKDLTEGSSEEEGKRVNKNNSLNSSMEGQGYSMSNGNRSGNFGQVPNNVNRNHLREVWSKRFASETVKTEPTKPMSENPNKRRRATEDLISWESYDEDVMVRDVVAPVINISDSEDDLSEQPIAQPAAAATKTKTLPKPQPQLSSHERTINIKREVMEEESLYSDDDIVMIDDEYDDGADDAGDELNAAAELADQSIIDDLFGEDTLLQEFQLENDVVPCSSRYQYDEGNDITSCPICFEKMKRSEFANHLEGCSITIKVLPPTINKNTHLPGNSHSINKPKATAGKRKPRTTQRQILKSSGYTDAEIAALDLSSSSDSARASENEMTPRQIRQRNLYKQTSECPKCGQELLGHQIEAHRKLCKRKSR
ncbi:sprT-like domain-containing protein Spartan [Drosophila novamexicana]|uniref:sprT-like domain-containing protein Spartan n=1 Tax=Drosophila novamexicana TaxID=47314 RepID=UPI0011E60094|nr:sprT-like domain-containing protein Spartan [Drosophila novamexicana]